MKYIIYPVLIALLLIVWGSIIFRSATHKSKSEVMMELRDSITAVKLRLELDSLQKVADSRNLNQ